MLASLVLSFTDDNLLAPADTSFVGADNYGEALVGDALVAERAAGRTLENSLK